ncbi:MAG: TrkA family potassium uptake protein [Bacteroidales bacterium]|nr:TrkA family potassium uptake protein [Lentimicrobiaceae bacterium]MDD5695586.1 TrkA family potassium uptake protein [Bacteroidales bacterium]
MNRQKYAVIGIGQFGGAIARSLSKSGAEVMAIDIQGDLVESISDEVAYAVALDATDKKALLSQDIKDYHTVVVAIGGNFEQELLCIVTLMDLGIKRIIARARGAAQNRILMQLGIKEIFSPEDEVGIIVAERLLNPNLVSYLQLPDDYRIAELIAPKRCVGRTLDDIDLRDRYRLSLVTIKKEMIVKVDDEPVVEQHIAGVPDSKTVIDEKDFLVVFGKNKDIDRFIEIND